MQFATAGRWVAGTLALVLGAALVSATATSPPASAAGGGRPLIHTVTFGGTPGHYTVVLRGQGFGAPAVAVPSTGDARNFRIADDAQLGHGEWGATGDANVLRYVVWTGHEVEVTALAAGPGDALVIGLWNARTGAGAAWGGNVPPVAAGTPVIRSLAFSSLGTPRDLHVVIKGSGFGAAPTAMPHVGDLDALSFWDGRSGCGSATAFTAGGRYFGRLPADTVTLRVASWTPTKIVVTGFHGAYGSGCARIRTGDPVAVSVWNSADTADTGPQTAARGLILYGIPGN